MLNGNLSYLDAAQIIHRAFDKTTDRLRVDAAVTANIAGPVEIIVSHVDDSIRIGDGIDLVSTTTVGPSVGLDVNIIAGSVTGAFVQAGLFVAGRTTTMDITDTAAAIPASPLSARNSMSFTNLSTSETVYIGFSAAVTADRVLGNNSGWEVGPSEGFNIDIQDDILLYGIAETGKTIRIKVMELA